MRIIKIKMISMVAISIVMCPIQAHHGSNVLLGGFMGAGMGAMLGGHNGVVPGMMTGLAVGTAAELMDHDHHHHHCPEVVYVHETRPSRVWLEDQIDLLEHKLQKTTQYIWQLEHELEKKDFEIHQLQKKLAQQNHSDKTEIIISAKAVS